MLSYTDKIRNVANKILEDGTVDIIIGFRKGTVPMVSEPCLITKQENVSSLIWNSSCRINLATYLTDPSFKEKKVAIVAKGCDSRNIVTHILENKIDRDKIYVIGVPCKGMIDRKKISNLVPEEITEISETVDTITVKTQKSDKIKINKNKILQTNCELCIHRNPIISDEIIAENVKEQKNIDRYNEINIIEKMNHTDKWKYFDDLLSPCIRCYACRNACPLCYCPVCFVDESNPQWIGKGQNLSDIRTFHFLRAYHCAGRCTDCGACEQACPLGINMRILTRKLEKECRVQFDWEAGLSLKHKPALDVYKPDDSEDFIK